MASGERRSSADVPAEILEATLADPRRRQILRVLLDHDEPLPLIDVAAAVRACELDTTPTAVSASERRDVCDEIFCRHLPKLQAIGLVEYDSRRGTVTPGPVDVANRIS